MSFLDGDAETAISLTEKAITENPEIFEAHTLLSEIYSSQGEDGKAYKSFFHAAHTRPRDVEVWLKLANWTLQRADGNKDAVADDVIYCYNQILASEPKQSEIRMRRAELYRERNRSGRARADCELTLKYDPYHLEALRLHTEACVDTRDFDKAKLYYQVAIQYYLSIGEAGLEQFSWSDVNIYIEIFNHTQEFAEGVQKLRFLSRWLLGRKNDPLWDEMADDREFDLDDVRRQHTKGFDPDQYDIGTYGLGMPLELRIKLGLFRLKIGGEKNLWEALVSQEASCLTSKSLTLSESLFLSRSRRR